MNNWIKTIFRHETQQGGAWYSVAVAGKDGNGEKTYEYWPVDLPQGTEIADRTKIEFQDFYISYYTKRDGTIQHKFIVQRFAPVNGYQQPQTYQQPQQYAPQYMNGQPQAYQQQPVRAGVQPRPQTTAMQQTFEQINDDVPF